ncbi:LysR family transcriptional regulator [Pseudoroseomonas globiformis]|uniref:LysR family transcriptional regulator n=1 Tax=Teichococcus globiformis TaxID=2307229 RepID=A0ABV7G3K6_9PROT
MTVTLRGLRAFATVLRYGSFTRAAALLNVTQPALTVQIRQLENGLGLRLLDRTPRGAEPTAAGRELARSLEPMLQELDHTILSLKDLAARHRGVVRLAALPSVASGLLPDTIARLQSTYPHLQVRLREAVTGQVYEMVRSEQVDLGLATDLSPGGALAVERLFQDRILALLPAAHPLARLRAIPLARLAGEKLLLLESDSSIRRLVDDAFAAGGHMLRPAFEAVHMGTLAGMARAGLGIALMPSTAPETAMAPGLVTRPLGPPELRRWVGLIRLRDRSLPPAAEALADILRDHCTRAGAQAVANITSKRKRAATTGGIMTRP